MPMTTRLRSGAGKRKNYRKLAGKRAPRFPGVKRQPLVKIIRSVVRGTQETKYVSMAVENNVVHNSAIGPSDQFRALPHLDQGITDLTRLGDKVRPVSLTVKGMISMFAPTIKPIAVRVLLLQLKGDRNWATAQTSWSTNSQYKNLLKYNTEGGGFENTAFSGQQQDLFQPVNRDTFDVLGERIIKLDGKLTTAVESSPTGTMSKSFSMRVKTPSVLSYGASVQNMPENFAPFVSVGYAYLDGTTPDTVTTAVIANIFAHLYYKDA